MLSGVAAESFGETLVSGIIISNTTWTCENSPYIVTASIWVPDGVALTIEPCVTVRFDAGTAFTIDGTLIAIGTNSNKITFTSVQTAPAPGDWGYIFFCDSSKDVTFDQDGNYTGGSILEYAIIEYAGGEENVSNNGAVRLNNAYPFINNCIIRNNYASGIRGWNLFSRKLKIANSEINSNTASQANGGGGINISGIADIMNSTIDNNTVNIQGPCSGCGGGGIYAEGNVTLSNNVISNNTAGSGGGIYAKSLKAGYGVCAGHGIELAG